MDATLLSKVVLPIALFIVMLGMGLSLTANDFRRVSKNPKAISLGLFCQLLLLPLAGLMLAILFQLPPILSVGLVILCLCPGGVTSNLFCYLARGNVALSITLTAITSLIIPFTLPFIATQVMNHFIESTNTIQLPVIKTLITLIAITIIPACLGMLIRKKHLSLAEKMQGPVKILSMVFLLIIIAGIMKQNWANLPDFFAQMGLVVLLLNSSMMLLGYIVPALFKLSNEDCISIGIETGIQNGTTALFITSTLLADPVMSTPAATYSLIMFATGGLYAFIMQRKQKTLPL